MDAINAGAAHINEGIVYLKNNAWPIAIMLAMWFYLRPQVMSAWKKQKSARTPDQIKDHDRDLRRVRQIQQLQAEQDAKIKQKELQEKKAATILPEKRKEEKQKMKDAKAKSGTSSLSMDTFTTPSYRPARRTVRRG